jgi:hypothetical protein
VQKSYGRKNTRNAVSFHIYMEFIARLVFPNPHIQRSSPRELIAFVRLASAVSIPKSFQRA